MSKRGKHRRQSVFTAVILTIIFVAFCSFSSLNEKYGLNLDFLDFDMSLDSVYEQAEEALGLKDSENSTPSSLSGSELEVHFIDVGQGKSILIKSGGKTALIDCGENDQDIALTNYLRKEKIYTIDILVGTHPHSDHIGSMDTVIDEFDIGTIIMPDIPDDIIPTTKTYTDVLMSISKKGLKVTPAHPKDVYYLGDAKLTVLGPVGIYSDLNNISAVIRLDYGGTSFIFTGDIEKGAESDLVDSNAILNADVLDVAHHGSQTSSTKDFLAAVSPKFAVISCGLDNSYGHPHRDPVERIYALGCEVYRTDLDGSVIFFSNGQDITVKTEK